MSEHEHTEVVSTKLFRKQTLYLNVLRACANCGAPGYWHADPTANPGCYNPELARAAAMYGTRAPVGTTCPQCGASRPDVENRGAVWSRSWRSPTIVQQLLNLFRRKK